MNAFTRNEMIEIEIRNQFRYHHDGMLPQDMIACNRISKEEAVRLEKELAADIRKAIKAA